VNGEIENFNTRSSLLDVLTEDIINIALTVMKIIILYRHDNVLFNKFSILLLFTGHKKIKDKLMVI
jgi:hypothetical protein